MAGRRCRIRGARVSRRLRDAGGFSLIEALTAIAITGIVAGVVVSRTVTPRSSGEVVAIVQTIYGVSEAVTAYRGTVGRYPSRVEDLVNAPVAASDLCGRTVPDHFLAEWRGPYMIRRIDDVGIAIGEATLRSAIRREPATSVGGALGTLLLDITRVELEIAGRVNEAFDDDADLAGGAIRWYAEPDDDQMGTLVFGMPVRGC